MAVDFDKFDEAVDLKELHNGIDAAPDTSDVPKGQYITSVEKMEITTTKDGKKLMFTMWLKIKEGKQQGRLLFFNRVISGNKSEKWTDAKAIKSVITMLEKFGTDIVPVFISYKDFAGLVLDIFQEIKGKVELDIDYDKDAFNSVSIRDVYDI